MTLSVEEYEALSSLVRSLEEIAASLEKISNCVGSDEGETHLRVRIEGHVATSRQDRYR